MKKTKRLICLLMILSSVAYGGCNESHRSTDSGYVEPIVFETDSVMTSYTKDGVLYLNNVYLTYYDVKTNQSAIVCSDPSCRHELPTSFAASSCFAVFEGSARCFAYIDNNLYFAAHPDIGNRETNAEKYAVYKAAPDGSNRKELAKIDCQTIDDAIYTSDNKVIISYRNLFDFSDKTAIATNNLENSVCGIYLIDLSDGSHEEVCRYEANGASIYSMSFDGANIYYMYINYSTDNGTSPDKAKVNESVYRYNIKDKTTELIFSGENINSCDFTSDNLLYFYTNANGESELHSFNYNGKDTLISTAYSFSTSCRYLDENTIIYRMTASKSEDSYYYIYEMTSGKSKKIDASANNIFINAVFDDSIYLLYFSPDSQAGSTGVLSKDEFLNGDFENVVHIYN